MIWLDLTGQRVRGETKQYTGTDFGYIQGKLARGYQIAAAFLSGKQQRFAVAGTLHPGKANTQSGACLLELLPAVESRVDRPRRRVEWVETCLAQQKAHLVELHRQLSTLRGKGAAKKKPRIQRQIQQTAEAISGLVLRLRQYRRENVQNPLPLRIVLRADSAFGTPAVIQQLLEMGYEIAMKSCVFRGKSSSHSGRIRPPIPQQFVQ